MEKTFNTRIRQKKDTLANWSSKNPILKDGEIAFVKMTDGEIRQKVGDGTTAFNSLPYIDDKIRTELSGKAPASHGTHVSYSTAAPLANGTASAGSAATVARSDHRHPVQTTVSGNAGSATKLQTARALKVGNTSKNFDGTAALEWTLAEIGAAAAAHSHAMENITGLTAEFAKKLSAMVNCSNTDFNTIKTAGFYFGYTGMTNAAVQSISVLEVIVYSNDWVLQRQTVINANPITYVRCFYNGNTWSAWYKMYTEANKPTKADVGLSAVENKSSATIRGELTKANVVGALGYTPPTTNTVYTHPTTSGNKHIPSGGASGQILRWSADGTAVWGNDNNTTYAAFKGATSSVAGGQGLVPAPAAGAQAKYLRADGTWQTPPDTNTTYGAAGTALGLVKSGGDVSISSGVISVNDDSHNHVISNIDGLQTILTNLQNAIDNLNLGFVATEADM